MKNILTIVIIGFASLCAYGQNSDSAYLTERAVTVDLSRLTFIRADGSIKETAKAIAQFRAKEFIINRLIGEAGAKEIKFETESLASDDSGGLISVAFNCDAVSKSGLLLAFIGEARDGNGYLAKAYGFRPIPLKDAQQLLKRIDDVRKANDKYLSSDNDVNNVYIEYQDIRFVIYRDSGSLIRVFWNGFEVIWEDTAFNRSKRRLDKWFKQ